MKIRVHYTIVTKDGRQRNSRPRLRYFRDNVVWRHGNDTIAAHNAPLNTHNATRILLQPSDRSFGGSKWFKVVCI